MNHSHSHRSVYSLVGAMLIAVAALFAGADCNTADPTSDQLLGAGVSANATDGSSGATGNNETPPLDPVTPPPVPPPPKPDFLVLANRQKVIGLPGYFPGVEYDDVTFSVVQGPAHGQLLGSAPNLCYVPAPNYLGLDSFTFEANGNGRVVRRTLNLSVQSNYVLPIGIPAPEFGISESHMMYAVATYDFAGSVAPYNDAGSGPYSHYVDFDTGSDAANPFGTASRPRKTIPNNLPAGSVVELHGTNASVPLRCTITGSGTPSRPIFVRGPSALNKALFRRPMSVQGNYVVCENLEFDAQDFGGSSDGANWFWVTTPFVQPYAFYHHVVLRHSLIRDQPTLNPPYNAIAVAVGVGNFDPALDDPNLTIEHVVVYDVEIRNFSQWNDYSGSNDHSGCAFLSNSRNCWVLDCHLHNLRGGGVGPSRSNGLPNQAPARNIYIGRNYIHNIKEHCLCYKNVSTSIASQNIMHTVRKSDSSSGAAVTLIDNDATPDWRGADDVWLIFNTIYDAEVGINHLLHDDPNSPGVAVPFAAGVRSRSYVVGNLLFGIHYFAGGLGNPENMGVAINKGQLTDSRIIGNTIYDCDHAIWLGLSVLNAPDYCTQVVRNNVVSDLTERFLQYTQQEHATNPNVAPENGRHIYLTPDTIWPYTTIENNLHFESVGQVQFNIVQPGGIYTFISTIQGPHGLLAETGFGAGSNVADPGFVNKGNLDFRLSASSPGAAAAASDEVYDDFQTRFGLSMRFYLDGTPRPSSGSAVGALPPASN